MSENKSVLTISMENCSLGYSRNNQHYSLIICSQGHSCSQNFLVCNWLIFSNLKSDLLKFDLKQPLFAVFHAILEVRQRRLGDSSFLGHLTFFKVKQYNNPVLLYQSTQTIVKVRSPMTQRLEKRLKDLGVTCDHLCCH